MLPCSIANLFTILLLAQTQWKRGERTDLWSPEQAHRKGLETARKDTKRLRGPFARPQFLYHRKVLQ